MYFYQQFSVCDYQLLSEKENSSHEASKPQHHKRIEISHTKAQSHSVTVGVQNFEPLHFLMLLENVKNKE
jgi:hypothetical protein